MRFYLFLYVVISGIGCASTSQNIPPVSSEAWPLTTIGPRGTIDSIEYPVQLWQAYQQNGIVDLLPADLRQERLQTVLYKPSEGAYSNGLANFWRSDRQVALVADSPIEPFFWEAHIGHPRVQNWLDYFQGRGRPWFERAVARLHTYLPLIIAKAKEYGVFPGIAALAFIESGMNPSAISRVGAGGMWQFMKSTGKYYGLNIDYWTDARLDPVMATDAAIRHLRDLYDRFESWPLAFAAYNAGPGRIKGAMRRGKSSDYWDLIDRNKLPLETRNYVPKIVAVTHLLDKYGITPDTVVPVLHAVPVPPATDLQRLAWYSMTNVKDIAKYNPAFRVGTVPPEGQWYVWMATDVTSVASSLQGDAVTWVTATKRYIVKSSASPIGLQEQWGLPARVIASLNGVSISHEFTAGEEMILPVGAEVSMRAIANREERIVHRVRSGETLSHIARKYRTSVGKIRRYNGLKGSRIYIGQRLVVKERPAIGKWANYSDRS